MTELASDFGVEPQHEGLPGLRLVPVEEEPAEALTMPNIDRSQWPVIGLSGLLEVRQQLADSRGAIAQEISRLQAQHDELLQAQIEVNGWIRDRR